MWLILLLLVSYPLVGCFLGCVPCCVRRVTRPVLLTVTLLWLLPAFLWVYDSPLSVCSPRIVHSYPHDRSDDRVWESFWCSRPCEGRVVRAASVAEVQQTVAAATHVRVVGAGHSTSDLQCSNDTLLSIDALCELRGVDAQNVATLGAGCTVSEAQTLLMEHGLQLRGFGGITSQRLGGALSTSLHGQHVAPFANHARALRAVLADGTVTSLTSNQPEFEAWLGSMGTLGVIVEVRLQAYPLEFVRCESRRASPADLHAALTDPTLVGFEARGLYDGGVPSYVVRECHHAVAPTLPTVAFEDKEDYLLGFFVDNVLLDALLFLGSLVPPGLSDVLFRSAAVASSREGVVATVNDFRVATSFHPHFDKEYAVPVAVCHEAVLAMAAALDADLAVHVFVRRVDAARGWLSWAPQDACAVRLETFRFTGDGVRFERRARRRVEAVVVGHNGTGHFGKPWFSAASRVLHNSPRVDDFLTYRQSVDPTGAFLNDYTRALFGAAPRTTRVLSDDLDRRLVRWRTLVLFAWVATTLLMLRTCRRPPPPSPPPLTEVQLSVPVRERYAAHRRR